MTLALGRSNRPAAKALEPAVPEVPKAVSKVGVTFSSTLVTVIVPVAVAERLPTPSSVTLKVTTCSVANS